MVQWRFVYSNSLPRITLVAGLVLAASFNMANGYRKAHQISCLLPALKVILYFSSILIIFSTRTLFQTLEVSFKFHKVYRFSFSIAYGACLYHDDHGIHN